MKAPIDVECLLSEDTSPECKSEIKRNGLTELDLSVMRVLARIESKFDVGKIEYERAIKVENIIVILIKSDVSKLIGKRGKILRLIKRELDSKIRIINTRSESRIIEDMLFPIKPVYISTVFSPEGKTLKVVIPKNSTKELPTRKETLEEALEAILKKKCAILEE